ncbi:MAG: hypothetical protein WBD55_10835 [Dehalococcoidia bacterium]
MLAVVLAPGCRIIWGEKAPSQIPDVEALIARSEMVRLACLDTNADGRVNAADAEPAALQDITGDGTANGFDRGVVRQTELGLPNGRPNGCGTRDPKPDWQVTRQPTIDCGNGKGGLLVLAVGGGIDELGDPHKAAGVRWMLGDIGAELEKMGVVHQLASVTPGLNGTERPQPDAEAWSSTYLAVQLERTPCLRVVLLGHSHGGAHVAAVTSRLEDMGLGDRVLLTVLVDRITALYAGNATAMPAEAPVFNIYQQNDRILRGVAVEQTNVENWDASEEDGPENGDDGGWLRRVDHVTIDNSQAVLDAIEARVVMRACAAQLCK